MNAVSATGRLTKRNVLWHGALVAWCAALLAPSDAPAFASTSPNAVQLENGLPWGPYWDRPASPGRLVEEYLFAESVAPGDTLRIHVSTTPAAYYRVEVFRVGWYAGIGARLVTCAPDCGADRLGNPASVPPRDPGTGEVTAPPVAAELPDSPAPGDLEQATANG